MIINELMSGAEALTWSNKAGIVLIVQLDPPVGAT